MDRVEAWFVPFVNRHLARFPREDWPDVKTEAGRVFFAAWVAAFEDRGIRGDAAERASLDLVLDPPQYLDRHVPAIVTRALAIQARETPSPVAIGREEDSPERQAALDALKALLAASKRHRGPKTALGERQGVALRRLEAKRAERPPAPLDASWVKPDPLLDGAAKPPDPEPTPEAKPESASEIDDDFGWI